MVLAIVVINISLHFATTNHVEAEVFSAMSDVEPLRETHGSFIKSLEEYLYKEEKRLRILIRNLNDYKQEEKKLQKSAIKYLGNAMNSFTLIKQLTVDFDNIQLLTRKLTEFNKRSDVKYPNQEDLEGAAQALTRLQSMYNLNITQLANGILNGNFSQGNKPYIEYTTPFSASDCLTMGIAMFNNSQYEIAMEWLLEALHKYHDNNEEKDRPFDEIVIVQHIRDAYHKMDDFRSALDWTKRLVKLKHEIQLKQLSQHLVQYEKQISEKKNNKRHRDKQALDLVEEYDEDVLTPVEDPSDWKRNYEALCRGEVVFSEELRKRLKCYYMSGPEPFLKIAPIKVEQLYLEPDIARFHDVISNDEVRVIQDLAKPNLQRATVNDAETGTAKPAKYRVSKSAWLWDSTDVVARVSRRVSHFTALSIDTAEALQVANYGIGGHYEPHYDFLTYSLEFRNIGDRIASVLFYMSNVEQGGATVFTELNLTVFPVKNSAIFWMNLHPSGEPDYRTRHGACPVLRGSKWESYKWLHLVGQEFLRPCTLECQS